MKSYKQMCDSLFNRRDQYIIKKQKRKKIIVFSMLSMICMVTFLTSNITNDSKTYVGIESKGGTEETIKINNNTNSNDVPITNEEYNEMLSSNNDIYGGSYLDNNNDIVVFLTKNTTENQELICKELNFNINNVLFKEAKYSLKYLEQLQDKIIEKIKQHDFDLLVYVSIKEDLNILEVGITEEDDDTIQALQSLDIIGGAIQIEYCEPINLY